MLLSDSVVKSRTNYNVREKKLQVGSQENINESVLWLDFTII